MLRLSSFISFPLAFSIHAVYVCMCVSVCVHIYICVCVFVIPLQTQSLLENEGYNSVFSLNFSKFACFLLFQGLTVQMKLTDICFVLCASS